MIRCSPRSKRTDSLFPYLTLSRSGRAATACACASGDGGEWAEPARDCGGAGDQSAGGESAVAGGCGSFGCSSGKADEGGCSGASTSRRGCGILQRKRAVQGKSVSVRVNLGGGRIL